MMTLFVCLWLAYELDAFSTKEVIASEKPESTSVGNESAAIASLHKSLQMKERELKQKEEALGRQERALAEKEKILAQQMDRYEKIIRELKNKAGELEGIKDARLESFRTVYEKMDPKKASKILEEMDVGMAAGIIGGMKGDRAAEILSNMSSEKARMVTERYVGKRTGASVSTKVNEGSSVSQQGGGSAQKGGEQ